MAGSRTSFCAVAKSWWYANKIYVHTSFLFFITIKEEEVLTNYLFVLQLSGLIFAIGGVFMMFVLMFSTVCI